MRDVFQDASCDWNAQTIHCFITEELAIPFVFCVSAYYY